VNLQEALEIEVRDLLSILYAEKLAELRVGDNAALEVRIEAVVCLHIGRYKLRYIRLTALALRRKTHEGAELISEWAHLEEGIVGTTSIPSSLVLRRKGSRVNLAALLGITSITLDCLNSLLRIMNSGANTTRKL
jgi:hypothetical protein